MFIKLSALYIAVISWLNKELNEQKLQRPSLPLTTSNTQYLIGQPVVTSTNTYKVNDRVCSYKH